MSRKKAQPSNLPAPGQCFAMPLRFGGWGACQVLGHASDHVDVVALDYCGSEPPGLGELERAIPLALTHHSWEGKLERMLVPGGPPAGFRPIGELPLALDPSVPCKAWGGWLGLTLAVRLQRWWDLEVPASEKARYKAKDAAPISITLGGTTITPRKTKIALGAGPHVDLPLPAGARVDWSVLDAVGKLTELEYHGTDASVLDYVASRRLITKLAWLGHGRDVIDVTAVGLRELRVDVADALTLRLSAELEELAFDGLGAGDRVRVEHPERGRDLKLRLWQPERAQLPPAIAGLEALTLFDVARVRRLDLDVLAGYGALTRVRAWGSNAALVNASSLRRLAALDALELYDFYDLSTAALPAPAELPRLKQVTIMGLKRSDADWLKKHWQEGIELSVRGAKNDAWVAANAENPLRDWVDDDVKFGESACKAYAKAHAALTKQPAAKEAEKTLRAFAKALNRLDAKYELIDTVRREQALDAYDALVRLTALDRDAANEWFEAERDF